MIINEAFIFTVMVVINTNDESVYQSVITTCDNQQHRTNDKRLDPLSVYVITASYIDTDNQHHAQCTRRN